MTLSCFGITFFLNCQIVIFIITITVKVSIRFRYFNKISIITV